MSLFQEEVIDFVKMAKQENNNISGFSSMLHLQPVKSFCTEAVTEMRTDFLKSEVAIKPAVAHKIPQRKYTRRRNILTSRQILAAGRFTRGLNCFMILPRLSYMALRDRKLTAERLMRHDKN